MKTKYKIHFSDGKTGVMRSSSSLPQMKRWKEDYNRTVGKKLIKKIFI